MPCREIVRVLAEPFQRIEFPSVQVPEIRIQYGENLAVVRKYLRQNLALPDIRYLALRVKAIIVAWAVLFMNHTVALQQLLHGCTCRRAISVFDGTERLRDFRPMAALPVKN